MKNESKLAIFKKTKFWAVTHRSHVASQGRIKAPGDILETPSYNHFLKCINFFFDQNQQKWTKPKTTKTKQIFKQNQTKIDQRHFWFWSDLVEKTFDCSLQAFFKKRFLKNVF